MEVKKEPSNRASSNDLKRFLEKKRVSRDMIRRAVGISVLTQQAQCWETFK
jgi:hypothetical protein